MVLWIISDKQSAKHFTTSEDLFVDLLTERQNHQKTCFESLHEKRTFESIQSLLLTTKHSILIHTIKILTVVIKLLQSCMSANELNEVGAHSLTMAYFFNVGSQLQGMISSKKSARKYFKPFDFNEQPAKV